MFSKQLSLSSLIGLCRILRHHLEAGLTLRAVFRQQAERGVGGVRPVAQRIRAVLDRGGSLDEALAAQAAYFPPIFLSLATVGEETGHLPEVFAALEEYFSLQQRLQREFRRGSFLPLVQLFLAFGILAFLIWVLGAIAGARGGPAPSVFGLSGTGGALTFLALSFGSVALVYVLYQWLRRGVRQQSAVDAFALRLPVIGPCVEAIALARFALALQLTLDSGMSIMQALRLSLQATGNGAYRACENAIVEALKKGQDLTSTLSRCRVFPQEFVQMVAVGEEGGRLPEIMRHQARHYHEEADRRMKALTRAASMGVWLVYAAFMVAAIFHLAQMYLGVLG